MADPGSPDSTHEYPVLSGLEVPAAPLPLRLWAKGILCLLAMIAYVAVFALYTAHDRQDLLDIVREHEQAHDQEFALRNLKEALALSTAEASPRERAEARPALSQAAHAHLAALTQAIHELRDGNPELRTWPTDFERHAASFLASQDAAEREAMRSSQSILATRVDQRLAELDELHGVLDQKVRDANREVARVWWIGSVLGIALFGALITTFFTRLAADIKALERRALDIVGGYRGPPLPVRRHDEVGGLMSAINRMQSALRHWEQQQEMSRQQRFHQEKMAAVGSLASAVAHEVMNPIAAIAGMAEDYVATTPAEADPDPLRFRRDAGLILAHTERIGSIMRQLSDLSARHPLVPEPLDTNGLVEGVCSLMRYDKRFRGIDLRLSLDPALPAAYGVADHITQVLMNLLINAADALDGVEGRPPVIEVSTAPSAGDVMVAVHDNGSGMAAEVQARAFDEFFTTKSVDRGTGIGLYLCRTLIEQNRGHVSLESAEGDGTTARFVLPALARNRPAC